ncbi:MAG: class glutamine amidotransferase [Solirubrobacteraceae bacterium]|nr:class glutamine amidotransferase [Solirubrobacteraceae bacterium]
MCRLFGLSAGGHAVTAAFWLLEAPDSLARQSRANPDGYGIATFGPDGTPEVDKQPVAAYRDEAFAREAREKRSPTFVAHVRYASTGGLDLANTHPFEQRGRVFAHNGHIGGLDKLDEHLGSDRALVHGDTDSERFFALATREIEARGGDVGEGLAAAAAWVAAELPLYAINCLLATPQGIWALRYPETHPLLMLERDSGGPSSARHFHGSGPSGRIRVRSGDLADCPAVLFATEAMDEDAGWRMLGGGELVHVDEQLRVTRRIAVEHPPAHPLTLEDLEPKAAASQRPA